MEMETIGFACFTNGPGHYGVYAFYFRPSVFDVVGCIIEPSERGRGTCICGVPLDKLTLEWQNVYSPEGVYLLRAEKNKRYMLRFFSIITVTKHWHGRGFSM